MKRVWTPLLPQIKITEQCESLYKRQIIFENPPEPALSFDIGAEKYNILVLCKSVHHVMSQFISRFMSYVGQIRRVQVR